MNDDTKFEHVTTNAFVVAYSSSKPIFDGVLREVRELSKKVLQTFLWVSSTLSRMFCNGDMRWTAWNCTGNCLG
jgi:hypothetical protein